MCDRPLSPYVIKISHAIQEISHVNTCKEAIVAVKCQQLMLT